MGKEVNSMGNRPLFTKLCICLLSMLTLVFAIKPRYGGEVTLRLNEPANFDFNPSDYSNLVFYSLLYENLFYLEQEGDIYTNLFSNYSYDGNQRKLLLDLRKNISFSDGSPVTVEHIKQSLLSFLELKLETASRLRRIIRTIDTDAASGRVSVALMYDVPDITGLLTAPELVLLPSVSGIFSGIFYPVEWEKDTHMKLAPNRFYPGGRSYLDGVKVVFYDFNYPDIFLGSPGITPDNFQEYAAGVYQNTYLSFPAGKVGNNQRLALYSLLKEFGEYLELTPLNSLTADEESPVSLNIRKISRRRVRSILRYSRAKLHMLSSFKPMEEKFKEFLKKRGVRMETLFLSESALTDFISEDSLRYLVMVKVFNTRMPIAQKIKKIVRELIFSQFNEAYLKMLNELEEVAFLKDEEMLTDHIARLVEKIINDGTLLPLFQKRYSFYVNRYLEGVEPDYYGRPLFQRLRMSREYTPDQAPGQPETGAAETTEQAEPAELPDPVPAQPGKPTVQ